MHAKPCCGEQHDQNRGTYFAYNHFPVEILFRLARPVRRGVALDSQIVIYQSARPAFDSAFPRQKRPGLLRHNKFNRYASYSLS